MVARWHICTAAKKSHLCSARWPQIGLLAEGTVYIVYSRSASARRRNRATRFTVSFANLGSVRQLGMARMGRLSCRLVVLPRSRDGVLRDPPLRGTARCFASLQVPHQREGCPAPREQGRHARCFETREGTDLLHTLVR